jgi:protein involved in polysaccharide export with SLBB domain
VRVVREGKPVAELDFYDFLIRGDRSQDRRLQAGDVVLVPPLGPVAALSGSVKRQAIYELKPGARLTDLLQLAGGLTPLADQRRCHMFRLESGKGRILVDVDLTAALSARASDKDRLDASGADPQLQDGDYVRVSSLPTQVANVVSLAGAVKSPGPYEYRPGMRLSDLLAPDQLTVDAYVDRAEVIRTDPVTYQTKVIQFSPKTLFDGNQAENHPLHRLDQVVVASQLRSPNLVVVEGEVKRPGYFTIEIGERLSSVLKRAGGFSPNSFPPGIVLIRESVKRKQQAELDRFIAAERQRLAAQSAGVASGTAAIAGGAALSGYGPIAEQQVLALRLQQLEAITSRVELGRVVLRLQSIELLEVTEDDIKLEARDKITIPQPPQTVSVIGSVKNPSNVVFRQGLNLEDYLRQAGGPTEEANMKQVYVMRANGTTESAYVKVKDMQPGDTIVVPQKIETKTPPIALWGTVASILGSVMLGVAAISIIGR